MAERKVYPSEATRKGKKGVTFHLTHAQHRQVKVKAAIAGIPFYEFCARAAILADPQDVVKQPEVGVDARHG